MATNPERVPTPKKPLEQLGINLAARFLTQNSHLGRDVDQGLVAGDFESTTEAVLRIEKVLDAAQVVQHRFDQAVIHIRQDLGYVPDTEFNFSQQSRIQEPVIDIVPEVEVNVTDTKPKRNDLDSEIVMKAKKPLDPVVSAEPVGFFIQEADQSELQPAAIDEEENPPLGVATERTVDDWFVFDTEQDPFLTNTSIGTIDDDFKFDIEPEEDDQDSHGVAQVELSSDRKNFVPERGELVFEADVMSGDQVTILAQALSESQRAGELVKAGVQISRLDLSALQELIPKERLVNVEKLSDDDRYDAMCGIVEKLMDYSRNPVAALKDALGHDGYLLLNILGPSIRTREAVLDLMDALNFDGEVPDFRALYRVGSRKPIEFRPVQKKSNSVPKAQLDRPLAGGDSVVTQRVTNRFVRETSPALRKRGSVSVEAEATRDFLDVFAEHVSYRDDQIMVVDKPIVVAEKEGVIRNKKVLGVLEIASAVFSNQPWYLFDNLDRTASGLTLLTPDKTLRDFWRGDVDLGIDANLQFIYSVLLQGMVDKPFDLKGFVGKIGGDHRYSILKTLQDRIRLGSLSELTMRVEPQNIYKNSLGSEVTEVNISGIGNEHQLRVLTAESGYPVVGEKVYAKLGNVPATRPLVHLAEMRLIHPKTKVEFPPITSDQPVDFKEIIDKRLTLVRSFK